MKNIQSYQEYQKNNEELNIPDKLKKAAAGVALGTGLALGSPQVAKSEPLPQRTEQLRPSEQDTALYFVKVLQRPDQSTQQIQEEMKEVIGLLTTLRPGDNTYINSLKVIEHSPGRIDAQIQFDVAPDNTRGFTYADLTILVKDGRYKVKFENFEFVHVGQQPNTPEEEFRNRYRPMVGTALSQQARLQTGRLLRPVIGQFADIVGGVVGGIVQDKALKPAPAKKNFKLSGQDPVSVSSRDYDNYVSKLQKATDYIIGLFEYEEKEEDF